MTDDLMDGFWRMRPGDTPSVTWSVSQGADGLAHLYAYVSPDEDSDLPRCGAPMPRAGARSAVYGDRRCPQCDGWYFAVVYPVQIG
jgi:hypothetical protein